MSAGLADSADRLPAWRMGIRGQAGSLTSDSPAPPKLTIDHHYPHRPMYLSHRLK